MIIHYDNLCEWSDAVLAKSPAGVCLRCDVAVHNFTAVLACRENIEKDIELERRRADNPDLMEEDVDAVPCITR